MEKNIRILARLDIKGPNVVKGICFEGLRVVGRPELLAPLYYQQGIDGLIYIDSVASLYGRNNLEEIVSKTAKNIYVPMIIGGGIRSVDDVRKLLCAGADRVAINTEAIKRPKLLEEIAQAFGSQCIASSIQAKYRGKGKYECLIDNGRECTGISVFDWAKRVNDYGVGEILVTSVDRDGTGKGYDLELISKLAQLVPIPVIACGGAGKMEDIKEVIIDGKADAVCAASIFHYGVLDQMAKMDKYEEEGNVDFLKQNLPFKGYNHKKIFPVGIKELKDYLVAEGIYCRMPETMAKAKQFSELSIN